ncbi:MAG: 30S ribosomal protein S8 [Vampirovibrionales bacterium]
MMYTDPIADMLTRIRNACLAGHDSVSIPHSNLKYEIALKLQAEGYVSDVAIQKIETKVATMKGISLSLKYDNTGLPVIRLIKRISRPGLRVYAGASKLQRVLSGAGVALVTTNRGLLTDREARKQNVGGEVLCIVY